MGYNYVLGSREEDNLFTPTVVHPKQFHENIVKLVGAGSQHIVVLTTDSPDNRDLPPFEMVPIKEEEKPVVAEGEEVKEVVEEVKEEIVVPVEDEKPVEKVEEAVVEKKEEE